MYSRSNTNKSVSVAFCDRTRLKRSFREAKRIDNNYQSNLTFHSAGISAKNVTLGIPRLIELINVSKKLKTPSLTINLKDSEKLDEFIRTKFEYKTLKDLTKNSKIINDPNGDIFDKDKKYLELFNDIPELESEEIIELSPFVLRIELNNEALEYTRITLLDIVGEIYKQTNFDDSVNILINDDNAEVPFIRIQLKSSDVEDTNVISTLRKIEVDFLNKIHLQGIKGIDKVFVNEKNRDKWDNEKGFIKQKVKILETEGTNLLQSFNINEVDHSKTISNDIIEVYNVLGIEAARKALLNELRMVLSFDASYVNYRHLAILSDIMTYKGHLMSITRHGINRVEAGSLVKSSFEESVEILTENSAFSSLDRIKGVSEHIMLGQLANIGTGSFKIILDDEIYGIHEEPVTNPVAASPVEVVEIVEVFDKFIPSSPKYPKIMKGFIPSEPNYAKLLKV